VLNFSLLHARRLFELSLQFGAAAAPGAVRHFNSFGGAGGAGGE